MSEKLENGYVQMFCANCGVKIMGVTSADGVLRITCPRCRIKIYSKQKNLKEVDIKLKNIN